MWASSLAHRDLLSSDRITLDSDGRLRRKDGHDQYAQKSNYFIDNSFNQELSSVAINQLKPRLANYYLPTRGDDFWACEPSGDILSPTAANDHFGYMGIRMIVSSLIDFNRGLDWLLFTNQLAQIGKQSVFYSGAQNKPPGIAEYRDVLLVWQLQSTLLRYHSLKLVVPTWSSTSISCTRSTSWIA